MSMIPQHTMQPSIARLNEQLDLRFAASRHTTIPVSHTRPSPIPCKLLLIDVMTVGQPGLSKGECRDTIFSHLFSVKQYNLVLALLPGRSWQYMGEVWPTSHIT